MFNLQDSCCLDINVDLDSHRLICGNKVRHQGCNRVKLKNILPALLNKSLCYPEDVYDVYRKVFSEDDLKLGDSDISFDIMYVPPGLLGIEFTKTHIYFNPKSDPGRLSCIIEVHYGILTIIMQKNKNKLDPFEFETHVEEGLMVKVRKGEKLAIPQGYFYTFVNTEEIPVIFVRVYRKEGIVDYNTLRRERGLAYFCIRKNARQEIVLNPTYKNTPKIRDISPEEIGKIDFEFPLYQILREQTTTLSDTLWV
jgi:oxalate decarboxylase/phosphoglucose isomerase-like protein (cupin superfamily)